MLFIESFTGVSMCTQHDVDAKQLQLAGRELKQLSRGGITGTNVTTLFLQLPLIMREKNSECIRIL